MKIGEKNFFEARLMTGKIMVLVVGVWTMVDTTATLAQIQMTPKGVGICATTVPNELLTDRHLLPPKSRLLKLFTSADALIASTRQNKNADKFQDFGQRVQTAVNHLAKAVNTGFIFKNLNGKPVYDRYLMEELPPILDLWTAGIQNHGIRTPSGLQGAPEFHLELLEFVADSYATYARLSENFAKNNKDKLSRWGAIVMRILESEAGDTPVKQIPVFAFTPTTLLVVHEVSHGPVVIEYNQKGQIVQTYSGGFKSASVNGDFLVLVEGDTFRVLDRKNGVELARKEKISTATIDPTDSSVVWFVRNDGAEIVRWNWRNDTDYNYPPGLRHATAIHVMPPHQRQRDSEQLYNLFLTREEGNFNFKIIYRGKDELLVQRVREVVSGVFMNGKFASFLVSLSGSGESFVLQADLPLPKMLRRELSV